MPERVPLVIGKCAFANCECLRQIVFEPDSGLEEVLEMAFFRSGLESFVAPPSLRKVGDVAFRDCHNLKIFELNKSIQELGWFCMWKSGIERLDLPPHIRMTPERLGLCQTDPKVLCLPEGLKEVGERWFANSDIERLVIPRSVKTLGAGAFHCCSHLREVAFESDSHLETIETECFFFCAFTRITIPKNVRDIGARAFLNCRNLAFVCFEEGSRLSHVGRWAFSGTRAEMELEYPNAVKEDRQTLGD